MMLGRIKCMEDLQRKFYRSSSFWTKNLILHVQKAVVISSEAVEALPEMMLVTADKMEAYIYNLPYDENPSSDSGWQKVRK